MQDWLSPGVFLGAGGLFATLLALATTDLRRRITECEKDRKDLRKQMTALKDDNFRLMAKVFPMEFKRE